MTSISSNNSEMEKVFKIWTSELKFHLKKTVLYFIVVSGIICLGTYVFFYIEHCYDVVPKEMNFFEKSFWDICSAYNRTVTDNTTQQNETLLSKTVYQFCVYEVIEHKESEIHCTFDKKAMQAWFEYTTSIATTIGKKFFYYLLFQEGS